MTNYVTLPRGLLEMEVLREKEICRQAAMVWMIEKALFVDRIVPIKGQPVELKRGQLTYSLSYLEQCWGWKVSKIRRFLKAAEKAGLIITDTSHGQLIITLLRYEMWASGKLAEAAAELRQAELPGMDPASVRRADTEKQAQAEQHPTRTRTGTDTATDTPADTATDTAKPAENRGERPAPDTAGDTATDTPPEHDPTRTRHAPDTNKNTSINSNNNTPTQEAGSARQDEGPGRLEARDENEAEDQPGCSEASWLPKDWSLPDSWRAAAAKAHPHLDLDLVAADFALHWHGQRRLKSGLKANWRRTFLNNCARVSDWPKYRSAVAAARPSGHAARSRHDLAEMDYTPKTFPTDEPDWALPADQIRHGELETEEDSR